MTDKVVTIPEIAPSDYTNTSRCIHIGPCIVKAVHVAAVTDVDQAAIYDGVNAQGKLKAIVNANAHNCNTWRPGDGTDFDYGIYVAVNFATTHVTVTYIPESRKAFI